MQTQASDDANRGTGRSTMELVGLIARARDGVVACYVSVNPRMHLQMAAEVCDAGGTRFEVIHSTRTLLVFGQGRGGSIRFVETSEAQQIKQDWRGRGREIVFDHYQPAPKRANVVPIHPE